MPYVNFYGIRLYMETDDPKVDLNWISERLDEIYDLRDEPGAPDFADEERFLLGRMEILERELELKKARLRLRYLRRRLEYSPNRRYEVEWFHFFEGIAVTAGQPAAFQELCVRYSLDTELFDFANFTRAYRRWCRQRVKRR